MHDSFDLKQYLMLNAQLHHSNITVVCNALSILRVADKKTRKWMLCALLTAHNIKSYCNNKSPHHQSTDGLVRLLNHEPLPNAKYWKESEENNSKNERIFVQNRQTNAIAMTKLNAQFFFAIFICNIVQTSNIRFTHFTNLMLIWIWVLVVFRFLKEEIRHCAIAQRTWLYVLHANRSFFFSFFFKMMEFHSKWWHFLI